MKRKKNNITIIIFILLIAALILLLMDQYRQKEKFSCGGCGGPSFIHSPWRITYDCDMVKYA